MRRRHNKAEVESTIVTSRKQKTEQTTGNFGEVSHACMRSLHTVRRSCLSTCFISETTKRQLRAVATRSCGPNLLLVRVGQMGLKFNFVHNLKSVDLPSETQKWIIYFRRMVSMRLMEKGREYGRWWNDPGSCRMTNFRLAMRKFRVQVRTLLEYYFACQQQTRHKYIVKSTE
jgi:hypothetical protein